VLFYHKNYNFRSTSSDDHKYRKNWNVIWEIIFKLINYQNYTMEKI
jgi:hypothetical protein